MFNSQFCSKWAPCILGLLRIVTGFLFLQHGSAKLLGMPHVAMFDGLQLMSLMGLAGVLELVGGTLVMIGLFTRPAAFVLPGQMAVAYFMAHAPGGFLPILKSGRASCHVQFCIFVFQCSWCGLI